MHSLIHFYFAIQEKNLCTITRAVYFAKYILNKFVYSVKYM